MKTLFKIALLGIFFALGLSQAKAQYVNTFVSKNFYKNGIDEYLIQKGTNNQTTYLYYTSTRAQRIKLITVSSKDINPGYATEGMTITKVRFPNDTKVYELRFSPGQIMCIHPNGKKQLFGYIPGK